MKHFALCLLTFTAAACLGAGVDWVRAGVSTNQSVWGIRGGLLWAIAPAGFRDGEPRGLIRLGYPVLPGARYDLINFIAIEPIVADRRGFSELERSELDKLPGKRMWTEPGGPASAGPGQLVKRPDGHEELRVDLRVERFKNGAHVRLRVLQRSDRPDEIQLNVFSDPDSAPLEYCILTATMGNMARTRQLWLKDGVVSSLEVYPDYKEKDFTRHKAYPLARLHRTPAGRVMVAITNDEKDPKSVYPFPDSKVWHYGGRKVTQYWAKEPGTFRDDLQVLVNGRYTYWQSSRPIPGGVAFENFELRERFYEEQCFTFGITFKTPQELGFAHDHN